MIEAILAAAKFVQVCPALLYAVCMTESSLRPHIINYNDGSGNSVGLCQIKVSTAHMFNKGVTQRALLDPYVNAYYAALYLDKQIKRYNKNSRCAVAAYNAGRCNKNGKGKIRNTRYVNKVFRIYNSVDTWRLFSDFRSCPKNVVKQ